MDNQPHTPHPGGAPSLYDPKYCQAMLDYFDRENYTESPVTTTYRDGTTKEETKRVANDLPTLAGFARKIGVHRETLNNWGLNYPEFFDTIKRIKDMQEDMLVTNGLQDLYAQPFAIFAAKNLIRWADKLEQTLTGGVNTNGEQQPVQFLVNLGGGFVPSTITLPAASTTSSTGLTQAVQDDNLAPQSPQDLHSDS